MKLAADAVPPGEPLLALIYLSSAAVQPDRSWIDLLMQAARVKNRQLGITGCLLHHDGSFMQYIEGPTDAVETLFDVIRGDPRHKDVRLMYRGPVHRRAFAGWLMAHSDVDEQAWAALRRYTSQADGAVTSATARLLLGNFLSAAYRQLATQ